MRLTERNEFGNYIGTNLLDDECICRSLDFDETEIRAMGRNTSGVRNRFRRFMCSR